MTVARTLGITVKPNARASESTQDAAGQRRAQRKSPPIDGKANDELIGLVADRFGCRRAAVTQKNGGSGRVRRAVIAGDAHYVINVRGRF